MDAVEPGAHRRRILRRLMERARADAASYHGLVRVRDGVRVATPCAVGPDALEVAFAALDGRPHADFEFDFAHAPPVDSFARHGRDDVPAGVRDGLWARHGIEDGLGACVCRDGRLLGAVFLYRLDGGRFEAGDVAAANSQLRWARTQLGAAEQADGAGRLEGTWVFDLEGRVVYGPAGRGGERTAALGRHVAAWSRGETGGEAVVAGHAVSLCRVVGAAGAAVVASVQAARPVVVDGAMSMTPLKRRIASHAAQGATVPEIAASLGRSPETVRTHLKRIYEHLGVASRVELAEACRLAWA